MLLTIDQLEIWEVFDSGYEASRSQKLHRQLDSGIRPTGQTSCRPPTDTNDACGGATEQDTVKRNAQDIHNRVQNGRGETLPEGQPYTGERTKRNLSLP